MLPLASQSSTSSDLSSSDSGLSSWETTSHSVNSGIWIVLFGFVSILATISNLLLIKAILSDSKRRICPVHQLLLILSLFAFVDYFQLFFEFSLGPQQLFPRSEALCQFYQALKNALPTLQATVLILSLICVEIERKFDGKKRIFVIFVLAILTIVCGAPSLLGARTWSVNEEQCYCQIWLGSDRALTLFYLFTTTLGPFWIPLIMCVVLRLLLFRRRRCSKSALYDDFAPNWDELRRLIWMVSLSYLAFFAMHAVIVLLRYTLQLQQVQIEPHGVWLIQLLQSAFLLVAHFWHFFWPSLLLVLDNDLKASICHSDPYNGEETDLEEQALVQIRRPQPLH